MRACACVCGVGDVCGSVGVRVCRGGGCLCACVWVCVCVCACVSGQCVCVERERERVKGERARGGEIYYKLTD